MKDTVDNFSLGIDDISDEGIDFDQFENGVGMWALMKKEVE